MAVYVGKLGAVDVGGNTVAEMGMYTLSGFTRDALDSTAFGDDVKEFVFGVGDGGEISISGNCDQSDTNGQVLIASACENASLFTGGDIKFYLDSTSYMRVDTGGTILITKARTVNMDKAGLATTEFTGKISGGKMIVI